MAYNVMDVMLIMALHATKGHSVKEFKRIAYKLSKKTTPAVIRGVLHDLQVSDDPVHTLFFHIEQFTALLNCCSEISRMGENYIGMAIHDDNAYPLIVDFLAETEEEQREDARWMMQNEVMVATRAVQKLLTDLQVERVTCKVLLFNNRGFSGIVMPFVNVGRQVWI